jgi:hypothetical protein
MLYLVLVCLKEIHILFSGEVDNGHQNNLLPGKGRDSLSICVEVCSLEATY